MKPNKSNAKVSELRRAVDACIGTRCHLEAVEWLSSVLLDMGVTEPGRARIVKKLRMVVNLADAPHTALSICKLHHEVVGLVQLINRVVGSRVMRVWIPRRSR